MAMPAPVYEDLASFAESIAACTQCPLSEGRTQVVFGHGNPHADLMFVGEAPGFHEDKTGVPFVGAAGQLLSKLLAGIGLEREDVYIANVLKCRPPGNRDPQPAEIEACEAHLFRQLELIRPKVVATLGNFATKLLSGRPDGITRVHGRAQTVTRRRPGSDALSDLPSGGGALHAADARGARAGFRGHPGADRPRARSGRAAAAPAKGAGAGRADGTAGPLLDVLLYDSAISGNCYKVRLLLAHLGLPCERREVDVVDRSSRPALLGGLNPAQRVPTIVLDDGRPLGESGAILWYFGEGTRFVPEDRYERAQVLQWMFFEQYDHEPALAVVRFLVHYVEDGDPALIAQRTKQGYRALDAMERHLEGRAWLVGEAMTLADIALYAYTHVADEGNFDLTGIRRFARGSTASPPSRGTSRSTHRCGSRPARPSRPRPSRPGSRGCSARATSSRSPASSARGRRPSSAAPHARSASRVR